MSSETNPISLKNLKPFPKGISGNPAGRRRGSVSVTALLKQCLTRAQARQIAAKLLELAKAGDIQALKILLDRIDGPTPTTSVNIANEIHPNVDSSKLSEHITRAGERIRRAVEEFEKRKLQTQ